MIRRYVVSLQEFWPYYVREHSRLGTRWLHFIGNTNLFFWLFLAIFYRSAVMLALAVVSSYALAWIGHFFIERNIPATFRYPLKAAICDMIMYYKMWKGEMNAEVENTQKFLNAKFNLLSPQHTPNPVRPTCVRRSSRHEPACNLPL